MFPLVALGLILYFATQGTKGEKTASSQARGWSILLQGPAALPQAAIPELLKQFGIRQVKSAFLSSPAPGNNVLTVVTPDIVLARVGQTLSVMGAPLTVAAIQPAPIA